jgi:hypothetical protein
LLESSTAVAFTSCTHGRASRGQNRLPDYFAINSFDTGRIATRLPSLWSGLSRGAIATAPSAVASAGRFALPAVGLGVQGRAREPDREGSAS